VEETVERLVAALEARSVMVFARIPHSVGARSVGLSLPEQTVVIFGNPQVGTPLMQLDPTVGIELPLRILVWDDHGTTRVSYRDPTSLAGDYALNDSGATLERMRHLLEELSAEAVG
jgi:uncharacterized protein (DUF302 family)